MILLNDELKSLFDDVSNTSLSCYKGLYESYNIYYKKLITHINYCLKDEIYEYSIWESNKPIIHNSTDNFSQMIFDMYSAGYPDQHLTRLF